MEVSFEDRRDLLPTLKEAMNNILCQSEVGGNYAVKVNLKSTFQKSIKIMFGY